MSNHVSVTGTFQHGFGRVWEVHDDRLPIDPNVGRFSDWADAVRGDHVTAPQLWLMPLALIAPAPADQCGALIAQDDGHGYEPPARRASIESSSLHDGFAGRLIWCRPDDRAASAASVRWRRIVSTDTSHQDWTARSVTAADPDGTTHRCRLPQSCSIAVTAAEQDRAHHWAITEGKTTYEGHSLESIYTT